MADFSSFNGYNVKDAKAEALLIDNAAKNLLPITLQSIKTINPYGTWNNNEYTNLGVTFAINTNDVGYVTSIVANRISNADAGSQLFLIDETNAVFTNDNYILNGVSNGSSDTYYITYISPNWSYRQVYNNDNVMNIGTGISRIRIDIAINYSANNVIFYPMVRRKQITDSTFEPYYRTNKQLDADLSTVESNVTEIGQNITTLTQQLQALTARVEALENG